LEVAAVVAPSTASLVPYAAAAGLLADVLPIESGANATTLREHTLRVAERVEAELEEERSCFIDGCPADWARLPIPEGRIVVGLMPGGSPGHDPDQAFAAAIPAGDLEPPPARFAINEALGEGRLAGPDDPAVKSAAPLLYHALVRWLPHQPNG
jgi:hypothetical protein